MYRNLLLSCLCCLSAISLSAQLRLKIEPLPAGDSWGVYVKPCSETTPSNNTITGSGQVTIHFAKELSFTSLTPVSGNWYVNATVPGPAEAPDKTYLSVGFITDSPKIIYHPDIETLLFTFKLVGTAPMNPALLENGVDPFDHLPNSVNTNPGNEISVIDFGVIPTDYYEYVGIFNDELFSCEPNVPQDTTTNPQDTIVVNPPDTIVVNPQDTIVVNPTDSSVVSPSVKVPVTKESSPTGTVTTDVTGVEVSKTLFTVSPNPAYDWVSIFFNDQAPEEGVVRLWSTNGAIIGTLERGRHDVLELNVQGLSSGLYFLSYESDGKMLQRERLVKQ